VGGKALWAALREDGGETRAGDPTRGVSLVVLSWRPAWTPSRSGSPSPMLGVTVWFPSMVIGVVSAAVTAVGMQLGSPLGERFGKRMEILGGLVLISIGLKILVEHLW